MGHFTPLRDYTHYDDVATPLLFEAGLEYPIVEELPTGAGAILVVQHPDYAADVVLRPEKIAQALAEY